MTEEQRKKSKDVKVLLDEKDKEIERLKKENEWLIEAFLKIHPVPWKEQYREKLIKDMQQALEE